MKPAEQLSPPNDRLSLCRRIEEASLNAWPAMQQMLVDGWLLRFAQGFTKRANSVVPLYPAAEPLAANLPHKVRFCENLYARERLRTIFRLTSMGTSDGAHELLDDYLGGRGYAYSEPTLVLTAPLLEVTSETTSEATAPPAGAAAAAPDPLQLLPLGDWLDTYSELSGMPQSARALHGAILRGMPQPCAYGVVMDGARPLACGLGVLEQDLLGLFDVVTRPGARRRGFGRALVAGLLAWGRQQGAGRAYLQMVSDNDPARALYDSLGFNQLYQYWYRVSA